MAIPELPMWAGTMSVWATIDRLVEEVRDIQVLRAHGLQLLAARRWREMGQPVPPELLHDERMAAVGTLAAPVILARVRSALGGPVLLLKGPEVARRYPDPALRPFGDLDLLVPDPLGAQQALMAAGFQQVDEENFAAHPYHQPPLRWPGLPLLVEIHDTPPWLGWMRPPTNQELFAAAVPASYGVDGILSLDQSHQALLLVAHSWRHRGPLPLIRDLLDVALMMDGLPPDELDALARAWRLGPAWDTTRRTIDALFYGRGAFPFPVHLWAFDQPPLRERFVIEDHLWRWMSGFWAPTLEEIPRAIAWSISRDISRSANESWFAKSARIGRRLSRAFLPFASDAHQR